MLARWYLLYTLLQGARIYIVCHVALVIVRGVDPVFVLGRDRFTCSQLDCPIITADMLVTGLIMMTFLGLDIQAICQVL